MRDTPDTSNVLIALGEDMAIETLVVAAGDDLIDALGGDTVCVTTDGYADTGTACESLGVAQRGRVGDKG